LAVVIGKQARRVSQENALDYVFGYSIGNDISQRPWQPEHYPKLPRAGEAPAG
jgi:2-keto-4-pentenoate hydratase/2-oxohepta-3-ene-1,7-dioic acid hydratase in catechol pathway